MKKFAAFIVMVATISGLSFSVLADEKEGTGVYIDPSAPTIEDSILNPPRNDFFETEDFVFYDKNQTIESVETVRFAVKNISTMALYLMVTILGVYALFEVLASLVG